MKIHLTEIIKVFPIASGQQPQTHFLATYYCRSSKRWVSSYVLTDGSVVTTVYGTTKEDSIQNIKNLYNID